MAPRWSWAILGLSTVALACDGVLTGGVPSASRPAHDGGASTEAQTPSPAPGLAPDAGPLPSSPEGGAPVADAGTGTIKPDLPPAPSGVWKPAPGTSWQWQLTGSLDLSLAVKMYDVDLFDVSAAAISTLKGKGVKVVCYFSAGSYEAWRPDGKSFPASVLGNQLDGWDERWLDHRAAAVRTVMKQRLDLAKSKGCDGVEPDNVDAYDNNPGFPLKASDQIDYNVFLANEAHARGLSIGLKNDLAQIKQLEPYFDWALNEQCLEYGECAELAPFIAAGKAVFHVEYTPASASSVCPKTKALKFDSLIKKLDLDAWVQAC